jgi:hypothetical protein
MSLHGYDLGVIGAATTPAPATVSAPGPLTPPGPILDLPLPQWPVDLPPVEPPAFVLARKESDTDGATPLLSTPQLPGSATAPDGASPIHPAALGDPGSPLLGTAHATLDGAQGVLDSAQHVLNGAQGTLTAAHTALNNAPTSLGGGATAVQQAAATLPPLPADPVGALMNGLALPAIPGIDTLFKPFLDLLSSFGTGVLGAVNPATLLSQSSQVIQAAMQIGAGALKSVDQVWQGQAARSAQAAGQQAQAHGDDTSQRGLDIAKLTEEAAAVVQRGNVQLTTVAQSFAAQATALAPVILTPPAQATLIASATESLGQAVAIVNATRGELAGYTGQLAGVVNQLLGPAGQQAADVAQSVAQNVGQPVMDQAQQLLSSDTSAQAIGLGTNPSTTMPGAPTVSTSYNGAHPGSPGYPGLGTPTLGGIPGLGTGSPSVPAPGGPGTAVPGTRPAPGLSGIPFGPGMPTAPGGTTPGTSGFMGAPGAGAQRGDDEQHTRNVQPYQSPIGNNDLTGPLGETAPEVIGQTHTDEIINDYEVDQL